MSVRLAASGVTDWLAVAVTVGANPVSVRLAASGVTLWFAVAVTVGANVDSVRLAVSGVSEIAPDEVRDGMNRRFGGCRHRCRNTPATHHLYASVKMPLALSAMVSVLPEVAVTSAGVESSRQ